MLEKFASYRSWFYKWDNSGDTFEEHIDKMSLYEFINLMENWSVEE